MNPKNTDSPLGNNGVKRKSFGGDFDGLSVAQPGEESRASRRAALLSILGGLSTLVACTSLRDTQHTSDPFRDQLDQDLRLLGARTYSDEGIPTFLVCENLAPSGNEGLDFPPDANGPLAATFRRYAEALPHIRANVSEKDVAKLIEVLAHRDFGAPRPGTHP